MARTRESLNDVMVAAMALFKTQAQKPENERWSDGQISKEFGLPNESLSRLCGKVQRVNAGVWHPQNKLSGLTIYF